MLPFLSLPPVPLLDVDPSLVSGFAEELLAINSPTSTTSSVAATICDHVFDWSLVLVSVSVRFDGVESNGAKDDENRLFEEEL